MKFKIKILFFLFLIKANGFAQPNVAKIEIISGKEYFAHYVKKGETLSKIAKMYKVSLADVLNNNSGKEDKINIGDKIKIPVTSKNRPKNTNTNETTNVITTTASNNSSNEKTKDYKVERGETVYGIAHRLNTTPEKIYELNPDSKNGILPGQILKIPDTSATNPNTTNVNLNSIKKIAFTHRVLSKETLFSLSRKYNISEDSIRLLNNGLSEGLKTGSTIQLLVAEARLSVFQAWEKSAAETNSIKDTVIKTNALNVFESGKKEFYNVGIMLPFQLDKNQKMTEGLNENERKYLFEPTRQAIDFYLGVMLAADSLKKAGLNTNLQVFDVGKDSAVNKKIISSNDFKKMDLIIGPFDMIETTAKAAMENKIPLLVPVACSNKVMLDNPYVFKSITTSSVIADETSKYIIDVYRNENLVLIDGKGKNDIGVLRSYKKFLNKYYFERSGKTDSIKTLQVDFMSNNTVTSLLREDKINVLIIPCNDYAYVSSALSNLNKFLARSNHKKYRVAVFGTDEWMKWDQIDITYKLRTNVHIPTPTFVDFDTLQVQKLTRSFRNRYKTDPDKYALMGFDLAYFWLSGFTKFGLDFSAIVQQFDVTMSQTRFIFSKMNETSGCLNKNVFILKYENYKLVPIKRE